MVGSSTSGYCLRKFRWTVVTDSHSAKHRSQNDFWCAVVILTKTGVTGEGRALAVPVSDCMKLQISLFLSIHYSIKTD